MGDLIQFKPKDEKPSGFDGEHILELHVYQHDGDRLSGVCSSDVNDYGSLEGRLMVAETLERMAWLVRKECADMDTTRGDLLAVAHAYAEAL